MKSSGLTLPEEGPEAREGDKRLRRIARAGKQWKKTMGRTADMEGMIFLPSPRDSRLIVIFTQLMYTDYAWSGPDYGRMTGT
jgi:hypothetical protein